MKTDERINVIFYGIQIKINKKEKLNFKFADKAAKRIRKIVQEDIGKLGRVSVVEQEVYADEFDPHVGCSAYPNCDVDPLGCSFSSTGDIGHYGHRS